MKKINFNSKKIISNTVIIIFGYFEYSDLIYFGYIQEILKISGCKINLFEWKFKEDRFKKFTIKI